MNGVGGIGGAALRRPRGCGRARRKPAAESPAPAEQIKELQDRYKAIAQDMAALDRDITSVSPQEPKAPHALFARAAGLKSRLDEASANLRALSDKAGNQREADALDLLSFAGMALRGQLDDRELKLIARSEQHLKEQLAILGADLYRIIAEGALDPTRREVLDARMTALEAELDLLDREHSAVSRTTSGPVMTQAAAIQQLSVVKLGADLGKLQETLGSHSATLPPALAKRPASQSDIDGLTAQLNGIVRDEGRLARDIDAATAADRDSHARFVRANALKIRLHEVETKLEALAETKDAKINSSLKRSSALVHELKGRVGRDLTASLARSNSDLQNDLLVLKTDVDKLNEAGKADETLRGHLAQRAAVLATDLAVLRGDLTNAQRNRWYLETFAPDGALSSDFYSSYAAEEARADEARADLDAIQSALRNDCDAVLAGKHALDRPQAEGGASPRATSA
jgi:hypothetical protein